MNALHIAFFEAICESPDEDAPRLVYADWLEEHGQAERAEFIRVQCQLARLAPSDPRLQELKTRQCTLLGLPQADANYVDGPYYYSHRRPEWVGPTSGSLPFVMEAARTGMSPSWQFRRGFVEAVCDYDGIRQPEALFRMGPVRTLRLRHPQRQSTFLASSCLARLTTLVLDGEYDSGYHSVQSIPQEVLHQLGETSCLTGLTSLSLRWNTLGPDGARLLASAPGLARLQSLDLYDTHLTPEGVPPLLESAYLANVTRLNLGGHGWWEVDRGLAGTNSNIGDEGVVLLASSAAAARLTHLDVSWNLLRSAGAAALTASPHLANLVALRVAEDERSHDSQPPMPTLTASEMAALRDRFGDRLDLDMSGNSRVTERWKW